MVTNHNLTTLTLPTDREIVLSRIFDAPRELMFKVTTDPELIPHWWGRSANTTIVDQMDVRPGGVWRYIQRSPDGVELAFNGVYREIVPPERIVYTFEFEGYPGHIMVETVTYEDLGSRTRLTSTALFESVEDRDGMLQSGMEEGALETWNQLEELLVREKSR